MKALSIRQPWAHMILHYGKDIENRTWSTPVRGRVLIHASKGMTANEWADAWEYAEGAVGPEDIPHCNQIKRGGIIGSVEIVACVPRDESQWFEGPFGFVLRNPAPLPFFPCPGRLGFFDAPALPYQVCRVCGCWDGDCSGCIARTGGAVLVGRIELQDGG
jgi:hypothetical protein